MSSRRGKKINPAKNAGSARDFEAGKRIGRPKQVWVWDVEPKPNSPIIREVKGLGHWEKVNV
jgi:hypothetical protein